MFRIDGGGNIRRIERRPQNWKQLEAEDDHRFIPERRRWDAEECELIARAIGLCDISPNAAFSDERWLKELAREFCRTRRLNLTVGPAINEWRLNRSAKRWLIEAKDRMADDLPYLVQLLWIGFERELTVPGRGQNYRWELELAAGQLLDPKLDQLSVMRWFVNNPDGDDEAVQIEMLEDLLEAAKTWEEAAQSIMEWFYDRKAADNPYFR